MIDWQYKVVKSQRGMAGQWFSYPATTFVTDAEALLYAQQFAAEQRAAGVSGTRILVLRRRKVRGRNAVAEFRVDGGR